MAEDDKSFPDWMIFAAGTVIGIALVLMLKYILKNDEPQRESCHLQHFPPPPQIAPIYPHLSQYKESSQHKVPKHEAPSLEEQGYYAFGDDGKMYHHKIDL